MQLTITLTESDGKSRDIIVNSGQRIRETLGILEEAGILKNVAGVRMVQSRRNGEYISLDNSYEDSGIFYGDIVILVR